MATHLERLLFAQGGRCFFCGDELSKADASVEHLVAQAKSAAFPAGGSSHDDNCVACCKALNHLLGSKSIKEKFAIVLAQRDLFRCPTKMAYGMQAETTAPSSNAALAADTAEAPPASSATRSEDTPRQADYGAASTTTASTPLSAPSSGSIEISASMAAAANGQRGPKTMSNPGEWAALLHARLESSSHNRPSKLGTLRNYIRTALAAHEPTETMISSVLDDLVSGGTLNVLGEKIQYAFADVKVQLCPDEWRIKVTDSLVKAGKARPRKMKTLAAFAEASLKPHQLKHSDIAGVIKALQSRGHVVVDGEQVRYKLPKPAENRVP